ncbi:MAG: hypothetical protein ACLU1V_14495 [Bacteroides fragilis]
MADAGNMVVIDKDMKTSAEVSCNYSPKVTETEPQNQKAVTRIRTGCRDNNRDECGSWSR